MHAHNEQNHQEYLKAASLGRWISLDGLGWDPDNHLETLMFAKENGIIDQVLISHDAGCYDPQKEMQDRSLYQNIYRLIP